MKTQNSLPLYIVHHIGTADIYTANTADELAAILDTLGDDADIFKL